MKETHTTPEYKEKQSKIMKEITNRPEVKAKRMKIMKEMTNRPEVKAKRLETIARKKAEKLQESANLTEFFISDPASD